MIKPMMDGWKSQAVFDRTDWRVWFAVACGSLRRRISTKAPERQKRGGDSQKKQGISDVTDPAGTKT
jgi:hypothetical protein